MLLPYLIEVLYRYYMSFKSIQWISKTDSSRLTIISCVNSWTRYQSSRKGSGRVLLSASCLNNLCYLVIRYKLLMDNIGNKSNLQQHYFNFAWCTYKAIFVQTHRKKLREYSKKLTQFFKPFGLIVKSIE